MSEDPRVSGLCLSGGGIRSSTFCLGVLQAFAKHNLLVRFDYLSTVSGGGYIGSCLTSLLTRPRGSKTREPWRHDVGLDGKTFPLTGLAPDEPDRVAAKTRLHVRNQMHHLRTHSEYLMSHRGVLSRDLLRALGQVGGGIVYTLAIYLLLLAVGVTLLHLLVSTFDPDLRMLQPKAAIALDAKLSGAGYVKAFVVEWWRQRILTPVGYVASQGSPWWNALSFWVGLFWAVGWLLWAEWKTERLATDANVDYKTQRAGWSADDEREARVVRWFNVASVLVMLPFVGSVAVAHSTFGPHAAWYAALPMVVAFSMGGLVAMLLAVAFTETFGRHGNSHRDRRRRSVRGAMIGSAWLGLVTAASFPFLLVALSALANLPFKLFQAVVMLIGGYLLARKPSGKEGFFGALRIGSRPALTAVTVAFLLVTAAGVSEILLNVYARAPLVPGIAAVGAFVVAAVALVLLGFVINANRASPHYFYRDRLTEAYLQTVSPVDRGDKGKAQGKPVMLLRNDEDLLLRDAGIEEDDEGRRRLWGPYHLIVAALNLRGSDELSRRSFLSDHFVFSPGFVGSSVTGFARTEEYEAGQLRLARAMAISGAAVASGAGFHTFWAQSFFATLFNVRLGYWMENPWWEAHHGHIGKRTRKLA
ncbi:MAG TPA: patatin-like phospholipase family protein, partial [Thermoanaerobaculia bacterium]|nr:patatin-like phospholipase family protein [Thermoanaerobaculia bacterium]